MMDRAEWTTEDHIHSTMPLEGRERNQMFRMADMASATTASDHFGRTGKVIGPTIVEVGAGMVVGLSLTVC
jgi:hypothetical protein